jgi:hypothetical protein
MFSLCPFWSRIAVLPDGRTVVMCSWHDLQDQQAKGFTEPEGWTRQNSCMLSFDLDSAMRTPMIAIVYDRKLLAPIWMASRPSDPYNDIRDALNEHRFDNAWAMALEELSKG